MIEFAEDKFFFFPYFSHFQLNSVSPIQISMGKYLLSLILSLSIASNAIAFCFDEAGQEYGIAPEILSAIARTESNLNPYAVNYNPNGTYDYCPMQINSSWHKVLGPELWNALADPCTCVRVGAWILADCISRHGYTWKAVGCYNAVSPQKQERYIRKVQKFYRE